MQKENLLLRERVRILNILTEKLKNDNHIYVIEMNRTELKVQGIYNSRMINFLIKKKFDLTVSQHGYIYLTKIIAGNKLVFIFTD
jgi:hypothetical protein